METFEIGDVKSGHTASVPVKIPASISTHAEAQILERFSLDRSKQYENGSFGENILLPFR